MTAPKVTIEDVNNAIKHATYDVLSDGRTTVCTLTLDNDFTVRGESSCVCKENFDAEVGRTFAFEAARRNVWPFLGFRLADRIKSADAMREFMVNGAK